MIGIDLGTTYSSVGYLVVNYASACSDLKAGKCDIISSLQPVPFNHGEQVKTQLAWDGVRQQFKWGDGVSVAIRNGDIPESGRIGLFKLGLDDSAHLNGKHSDPFTPSVSEHPATMACCQHQVRCARAG